PSLKTLLTRIASASALSLTVLVPVSVSAHEPTPLATPERSVEERFELLLETIDVVPQSREAFEAAFPGARERLDAAAR
ncbi:MAG TPA: hypothetical protein PK095_24290, partial [Myxococcota bacterium]|nr:hypothetical protein [Myxococcota bacterium]